MLPSPKLTIQINFSSIINAFQDIRYIGELRQRWDEIKKLHLGTVLFLTSVLVIFGIMLK